MAPQQLSDLKPCQGPLCPHHHPREPDKKWWVGRSWEMGLQGEKLGALLLLSREKGFFQAAKKRGDHAHGTSSWEGCFWPSNMGIRKLPWPKPPGIFHYEREEVINRKILISANISPLWGDRYYVGFCTWKKKKKELFKCRSHCEKSLRSLSWISFPKPSLGVFLFW